jgi:exopolysaccharide biosynthesis polyprenyl glycosylphosphotransferase
MDRGTHIATPTGIGAHEGRTAGSRLAATVDAPSVEPDVMGFRDVDQGRGEAPAAEEPVKPVSPPLRRILVAMDMLVIAVGWGVAFVVAYSTGEVDFGPLTAAAQSIMMLGAGALLLSAAGLYRRRICAIRSVEVARIGRVSLALAATTAVVLAAVGREPALFAGVLGGLTWFVLLSVERGILREWISGRRASGDFGAPVLVIGGGSASTIETANFLADNPVLGFRVSGVSCPPTPQLKASPFPWYGATHDVVEQVRRSGASGVVVDSSSLSGMELNAIVQELETTGLHVHISSGLRGIDVRRISVSPLADEAFLHVAPLGLTRRQVVSKRAMDVVGAGVALLLLSPILLLSGFLVWAGDRGPVFFRQERVGKDREGFQLYKLRTMVVDAERLKAQLEVDNERTGPLFKLGHDPRITRIGRFLRSSSIDEIPQLFNVLEGTMSLVGPRPALPDEVAQFDDHLNTRLSVKPGVTGLWQVEARDLPSFDLYRRYDLLYVQNWSLGVDVAIVLRTVVVVGLRACRAILPARFRGAEFAA